VVKLGGSLAESGRLARILDIVGAARAPVVVVPGGGTFADAVRQAQAGHGFAEAAAHRMAILAMHQTGLMLAALHPRLTPVETLAAIGTAIAGKRIPVWLPLRMTVGDKRIAPTWETTSDGLAARLAERLRGAPIALVKSCAVDRGTPLVTLVGKGIVDPAFAAIVQRARLEWLVLGAGDEAALKDLLMVDADFTPSRGTGRAQAPTGARRRTKIL
jgi:hypothetical protein